MIIDLTYFKGNIKISNLNDQSVIASITEVIERTEKQVLTDALGYSLYKLFIANQTDQRFKDILSGKEFEFVFNNKTITRKWNGLKNADKISPLAFMSYYNYISENNTSTTTLGEINELQENGISTSPATKLVNAYNSCVELIGEKVQYNSPYYTDRYTKRRYQSPFMNDNPSLYNFLLANLSTYPEWEFKGKEYTNVFGF